jgi:hypothetical protein
MNRLIFTFLLIGVVGALNPGCATYHEDYRVEVITEPPGAEVWKGNYFLGRTPHVLHFTATWEDKEQKTIAVPPLTLKKKGYLEHSLDDLVINLEEGYNWECRIELKAEAEN